METVKKIHHGHMIIYESYWIINKNGRIVPFSFAINVIADRKSQTTVNSDLATARTG